MQRWKLTVEYDGAGFSGWQWQKDARSVQSTIEDAIKKFEKGVNVIKPYLRYTPQPDINL